MGSDSATRQGGPLNEDGLREAQGGGRILRLPDGSAGRQADHASIVCGSCCSARAARRPATCSRRRPRGPPLPDGPPATGHRRCRRPITQTGAGTPRARGTAATAPTPTAGAEKIQVPHGSLHPGDPCPDCRKGTVYELASPGVLVRIVGQAPVQATVYELQKLRCNLCGKVFTAAAARGRGRGEVRRDGGQHDRPAEVRERDALQSPGGAAGEPGHSPAGLDPVGHRPRRGRARSSRPSRN